VTYGENGDGTVFLVDAVDHPVLASACDMMAFQDAPHLLAHTLRLLGQRTTDELNRSRSHVRREAVERSPRRCRKRYLVAFS
jgi:hypothetical protein